MARSRAKILRRILIGLMLLPLIVWLGISIGVKLTIARDMPFMELLGFVGQGMASSIVCAVGGCEAELLEGMEIETYDETLLTGTPVALDIDEQGRVYVAETGRQDNGVEDNRSHPDWLEDDLASRSVEDRRAYYEKAIAAGAVEPDRFTRETDRIVRLEDRDGDGVADERVEVASWNDAVSGLAAGVEVREGTVWATSIPSVHRLRDLDGDGVSDESSVLATGFGVKTSLIGHDLHGLAWGPDGKLYFSMGDRGYRVTLADGRVLEPSMGPGRGAVFRMNPDGSALEVFATGVRNPQELAFDDHGNLFTGDNNGDGGDAARIVYVVEGGETGWAMPFQTLAGDYVRGPWVAERLWDLQHDTQPAWVLPPVAHIANGPAGFVHYPGLGLPERYRNHFFLCDYAYMHGRSGVWSFALEPKGAGFEMIDRHKFAWSLLATDFDFSWDGRMFASLFDQVGGGQQIVRLAHPASRADPRVAELEAVVRGTMADKSSERLLELLSFPDQRVRLRAQFELAARDARAELVAIARDRAQDRLARLHAIWALGQIGRPGLQALNGEDGLDWARGEEGELRAQLARVAGEAGAEWLAPDLRRGLADPSSRVRFFSAQSLGALRDREAVDDLFELIRENADRDVFLRHAAIWALHRIGDVDAVWLRAGDGDRSVRLAVLLVWRQAGDPRMARFLADPDELIRVEAARAIYDWPIEGAMADLAGLIDGLEPVAEDDLQTGQALHRRVIGANVRLRSEAGALALARYAADDAQLGSLREMALDALGSYAEPPRRDLTMGFYRPLEAADPGILTSVLALEGRRLVSSSLSGKAMEIAQKVGALPLDDQELLEIVTDTAAAPSARASAVAALRSRRVGGELEDEEAARRAADAAMASEVPGLRAVGRELLFSLDPARGLDQLLKAVEGAPEVSERKHAWRQLGRVDSDRARDVMTQALVYWQSGELETAVALEVIDAALEQPTEELAGRARSILAAAAEAPLEGRLWALDGGDPEAGRLVFQTYGDCQRCHGGGGHGAGVGPDLAGISQRGARYVLESLVDPGASIAEGFATVRVTRKDGEVVTGLRLPSGAEDVRLQLGDGSTVAIPASSIESTSEPATGMPPMGLGLEPGALRDVVAYVMSLE